LSTVDRRRPAECGLGLSIGTVYTARAPIVYSARARISRRAFSCLLTSPPSLQGGEDGDGAAGDDIGPAEPGPEFRVTLDGR
jgi:hypothetical protein